MLGYRFSEAVAALPHVSALTFTCLWCPLQFCAHSHALTLTYTSVPADRVKRSSSAPKTLCSSWQVFYSLQPVGQSTSLSQLETHTLIRYAVTSAREVADISFKSLTTQSKGSTRLIPKLSTGHDPEPVLPISIQYNICTQYQWRTEGGVWVFKPPRNSEGPPKSCQTQPDCENC